MANAWSTAVDIRPSCKTLPSWSRNRLWIADPVVLRGMKWTLLRAMTAFVR